MVELIVHMLQEKCERTSLTNTIDLQKTNKSVLRNIYKTETNDCSVSSEIDERVTEAALQLDDPHFLYDLCTLNGKPQSTKFDAFWDELKVYIEEQTPAVDDKRHSETPHLPIAISLRYLQQVIEERLRKKFPDEQVEVPSQEWIRLQFWPKNSCSPPMNCHRSGEGGSSQGVKGRLQIEKTISLIQHFAIRCKRVLGEVGRVPFGGILKGYMTDIQ